MAKASTLHVLNDVVPDPGLVGVYGPDCAPVVLKALHIAYYGAIARLEGEPVAVAEVKVGGSREVWLYINERLGEDKTISRATIINFLKAMDEEGVLESREVGGKGGYRPVYRAKMDENGFVGYVIRTIIDSLMRDFPQKTTEVLKEIVET